MFFHVIIRLIFLILGTSFIFRGYKDFKREIYFDNPNSYVFLPLFNWLVLSHKIIFISGRLEVTRLDMLWVGFLFLCLVMPVSIIWYRARRYFKLYIYNIEPAKIYDAIKYALDKSNMSYMRKEGEIELSLIPVSIKGYYGENLEPPYIKVFNHKAMPNFKGFVIDLKEHIRNEENCYRTIKRSWIWMIYLAFGIAILAWIPSY